MSGPQLSLPAVVAVDVLAAVAVQVSAGYLVHRLPARRLAGGGWLFRARAVEADGRLYERVLHIRRWKPRLPEAGAVFRGGFDKARMGRRDDAFLTTYMVETRRAELGHWLAMLPAPLVLVFNPWYAGLVVQLYALGVNGPCIAAQRYNRLRVERVLRRRAQRKTAER